MVAEPVFLHEVMCESKKEEDSILLLGMNLLKEFIRTCSNSLLYETQLVIHIYLGEMILKLIYLRNS